MDKEVWTDPATGLEWQVNHLKEQMTWDDAISYCISLIYAGYTDWRLPTDIELSSIIDKFKCGPACIIPETRSSNYWSSTPDAHYTDSAWRVYFGYGYVGSSYKYSECYVRAVRGGKICAS